MGSSKGPRADAPAQPRLSDTKSAGKRAKISPLSLTGEGKGGACIQCRKGGCFTAWHVTCGQLAGYHMVMLSGTDDDEDVPALAVCQKSPISPRKEPYIYDW